MATEQLHSIHSQAELKSLLSQNKFVVIDFWAEWCPPCKAIGPFYSNLAKTHSVPGFLAFAKIDVDELPDITKVYGISAMPSFLVLEDGEPSEGIDVGGATAAKVKLIRGADPKGLTALAAKLKELASQAQQVSYTEPRWGLGVVN